MIDDSAGEKIVIIPSQRFSGLLCLAVVDDNGKFEEIGHYPTQERALSEGRSFQKSTRPDLELKVGRS